MAEPLLVVIQPYGILPKAIQLPYGIYSLTVLNRSGIDQVTVEVDRMAANSASSQVENRTGGGLAVKRTARWSTKVQLSPGYYRLRVAERPYWYCLFEVLGQ